MKILSVTPFILHVPVTGASIADSTHTVTHWGVVGAQIGARIGARFRAEQLRAVLGAILVATSIKFALDLVLTPDELYVLAAGR